MLDAKKAGAPVGKEKIDIQPPETTSSSAKAIKNPVEFLFSEIRDTLNQQFNNYFIIRTHQINFLIERQISEREREENRKISEDEKEEIREKIVEQSLKSEVALEEEVAEQIVLCGDLKVILKKIKVAKRNGTFEKVVQRIAKIEEAGSFDIQRVLEIAKDAEKLPTSKVIGNISSIKEAAKSELGKEIVSVIEESKKSEVTKEKVRERIKDVAEQNMKEATVEKIDEKIKTAVVTKNVKKLEELLKQCKEDERCFERALRELPKFKGKPEEFRKKCDEIFKDRPKFLEELKKLKPDEAIGKCKSFLDELQSNRFIERIKNILSGWPKKALSEAENIAREIEEVKKGCARLKEIIEADLDKKGILDALSELTNELTQGRLKWRLEELLKEHEIKLYSKKRLIERMSQILRTEYVKLLVCRAFAVAATKRNLKIADELSATIARYIERQKSISFVFRRTGFDKRAICLLLAKILKNLKLLK